MKKTGALTITTPSDREIAMTRVFDAPRELVFDAYTKPELLVRWFGPPGWSLVVCEIDLKVGGSYRYVMRSADGQEMGISGVHREIVVPERLVVTEKFDEAWYPGDGLVTAEFAERGGKTTFTLTVRYDTKEVRDMVLKSPMDEGVAASYERLAALLAETR